MNPNCYKSQKERGIYRKLHLIEYLGGKCEMCGYDKNIAALEFHHKNPEEKSFQLDSRHLSNTNVELIKKEADKCLLICANCHRELHNPDLEKCNVENLKCDSKHVDVLKSKRKQSVCPICNSLFDCKKGKKYCSKNCRDEAEGRNNYPSNDDVTAKYQELKSWQKVADYYGLTRRIIQLIRNKNS